MQKIIEGINYYSCGFCTNNESFMFKNRPFRKRTFPAGVFLIKHREHGYILYDAGFSTKILNFKLSYIAYRITNPTIIEPEHMIHQQLQNAGIKPDEIKYIILSHLHPDHIGGVEHFAQAKFFVTDQVFDTYLHSNKRDLIFKEFLPSDFKNRVTIVHSFSPHPIFPYRETVDLFGDGSMYITSVGGHVEGQACLYIPEQNLFIGSDLTWGVDLIEDTEKMRFIPKLIQHNFEDYIEGVQLLQELQKDGIQIVVSHDQEDYIEGILK